MGEKFQNMLHTKEKDFFFFMLLFYNRNTLKEIFLTFKKKMIFQKPGTGAEV